MGSCEQGSRAEAEMPFVVIFICWVVRLFVGGHIKIKTVTNNNKMY